ncbi:MAG: hypothetical protein LBU39_00245 [Desulfobulbaceae bacterium]|nr:hypothetical protein [Desulfobulbaceae bacterium]
MSASNCPVDTPLRAKIGSRRFCSRRGSSRRCQTEGQIERRNDAFVFVALDGAREAALIALATLGDAAHNRDERK